MVRKHRVVRVRAVTANDVALAACRALVRSETERALVLARFAVAMKT